MPSEYALQLAGSAWTRPGCTDKELDADLAFAFAEILDSVVCGYHAKYTVTRNDGAPFTDADNEFFVLCFKRDPHAARALAAYANSVLAENPQLANDLYAALDGCTTAPDPMQDRMVLAQVRRAEAEADMAETQAQAMRKQLGATVPPSTVQRLIGER